MRQLNVVILDNPIQAQELLLALTRVSTESSLTIEDAVFVQRGPDGRVRVHETADVTPGEAAFSGGFWGLLLGTLLLGPLGGIAVGAASAGGGALIGSLVDAGVNDEFVENIKEQVTPGQTALILLTYGGDLETIRTEMQRFAGAELYYSNLPPEARTVIEDALRAGHAVEGVDVVREPPAGTHG